MIWYPAEPQPEGEGYLYNTKIRGSAMLNAPVSRKGAPYSVLLFSHGLGECGCMSVYYTENLASFGYVVVAPDHRDSMMCHIEGKPDISFTEMSLAAVRSIGDLNQTVIVLFGDFLTEIGYDFSYRAREARSVLDRVLEWNGEADSFLRGMIDPARIGMTGHSLGGFTSLAIGGLPFRCDQTERRSGECYSRNTNLDTVDFCCIDAIRNLSNPFELRDRRVKAILPLGPALFFPTLEKAAKELEIPVMTITGDDGRMEVPWRPIWTLYKNAPSPKYVIRLEDTDHMTITDFLLTRGVTRPLYPGYRFNFEDKAQAYKDYSVAFFDRHLKGDETATAILTKPSNRFVELWQEAG
jgi:predicted dienelactone hydrolase